MSKYSFTIQRTSESNYDLEAQMEDKLSKEAVQSRRVDDSLYNQMYNIMNVKSPFPSVEAAVEDMKQRSGLTDYLKNLNKKSENNSDVVKTAQAKSNLPSLLIKHPDIRQTFENVIKDTRGNISIPAVIDNVRSIHKSEISDVTLWDDPKLLVYVSQLNLQEKANNPQNFQHNHNLGKRNQISDTEIDPSNTDAFFSLQPAKG